MKALRFIPFLILGTVALLSPARNLFAQITLVNVGHASNTNNGGTASAVVISNGYAYLANGSAGLCIYDISNPAMPSLIGQTNNGGFAESVAVSGNFAYLANELDGLQIYDVSNPNNPVNFGNTNNGGGPFAVEVAGHYAYTANVLDGLRIYDVSDPANPVNVGHAIEPASAMTVIVSGNYAYVACNISVSPGLSLAVNDVSNPTNPVVITNIPAGFATAFGAAASGRFVYLAEQAAQPNIPAGLEIFDISSPKAPVLIGGSTTNYGGKASGVAVSGNYAYLANEKDGLRIFDVTTPANLVNVGHTANTNNGGSALGVAISGNHVYVANGLDGLRIYAMMPQLSISAANASALLFSWPAPASYVLQQNADLTTTNWTTFNECSRPIGSSNQVVLTPPAGNMFYRLISQ